MKEETYKRIDIPFDAENIEMDGYSLNIPEGFEAVIENNKVVIKRKINKIKEAITYILANTDLSKVSTPFSDMLKWLETAKDNFNFINKIQIGDKVTRNKDGMLVNLSQLNRIAKKDEQKPADKTEPKFHEGDWVVYKCDICQIVKREEGCNKLVTNFGIVKELVNERNLSTARLWTIQDAKDGDVLAAHECIVLFKEIDGLNIRCYCTYHFMNNPSFYVDTLQNKDAFHPATKEQSEKLFMAMHEAGYEWDANKKELTKIEQKPQRIVSAEAKEAMYNKPTWSKEEGRMLDEMYEFFDKRKFPSLKHCMDDYAKLIKFLKERVQLQNHWKPSKEQMEALYEANTVMYGGGNYYLTSLYNDLKKLKKD